MTIWLTHIQKRIDTNAKLIVWLGCITKKAANTLKSIFSESRSTEAVKAPKDYATTPYNKYKWEKLTGEHDEWN